MQLILVPAAYLADFRRRRRSEAARGPWAGVCETCRRRHDEEGRLLLVARRQRGQRFLCFDCWLLENRPSRRRAA
jgi:hypothetical protein